jgi:hypothetical protein
LFNLLNEVSDSLVYQSEQVVACAGACAMLNASADPTSLSCRANVCGEAIEVWTEADAQRPKTLQHPVIETSSSATNGISNFCIIIDLFSQVKG